MVPYTSHVALPQAAPWKMLRFIAPNPGSATIPAWLDPLSAAEGTEAASLQTKAVSCMKRPDGRLFPTERFRRRESKRVLSHYETCTPLSKE